MSTLIGVHFLLKTKPRAFSHRILANSFYNALPEETKRSIGHYETAVLRRENGGFYLFDSGLRNEEENLLANKKLAMRRIDFLVDDPLSLERRMMAGEAFRTLNNAEKNCFADGFAGIIFRQGAYYFVCDPTIYDKYVQKFGTDCKSCDELKKIRNK